MEHIAEPLILIMDLRRSLERGASLRRGLEIFTQRGLLLSQKLQKWLELRDEGENKHLFLQDFTIQQILLLDLIEKGLTGVSIYKSILLLEAEFIEICEADIAKHISSLPFKLLFPLFCFIFPAFAVLLIGPLLSTFFT